MRVVKGVVGGGQVSFLEPAMGLGAFCSAAVETFGGQMCKAVGFEVDERYGRPAQTLLERIPNRHPHRRLTASTAARGEVQLSCCQPALRPAPSYWGGRQGGPSRQGGTRVRRRDVAVKQFLVSRVRLLRVHRFAADSVQFGDALVSSCVVVFRNVPPDGGLPVELTSGGSLGDPASRVSVPVVSLRPSDKWTPLFSPHAARRGTNMSWATFSRPSAASPPATTVSSSSRRRMSGRAA